MQRWYGSVRLVFDSVFQLNHIIVAALRCGVGGRRSDSEAAEGFRRTVSGRRLSPETLGVDREQWMQLWAAVTDKPFTRVSKINQGYFARGMRCCALACHASSARARRCAASPRAVITPVVPLSLTARDYLSRSMMMRVAALRVLQSVCCVTAAAREPGHTGHACSAGRKSYRADGLQSAASDVLSRLLYSAAVEARPALRCLRSGAAWSGSLRTPLAWQVQQSRRHCLRPAVHEGRRP